MECGNVITLSCQKLCTTEFSLKLKSCFFSCVEVTHGNDGCLLTCVNTILVNCFALQHIFPLANRNVIFLVHLSCYFAQSARCGKCQTIQNFTRHCCVIQISVSRFRKKFPSTFCNVTIMIAVKNVCMPYTIKATRGAAA